MSDDIYSASLLFAVAWPLLLSISAVHSRVPWPRHLAILPAVALTVFLDDTALSLPWVLFGTGFAIDGETRWILAMSALVWLTAATVTTSKRNYPSHNQATTFFLLTMSGNLGIILTTELVSFFSFSALMGYGFYSLLVDGGDEKVQRAGRLYLVCLILADLLLFEALLLAASETEDMRFETVRQIMAMAPSISFYLFMVIAGFALKIGIWPLHLWLSTTYRAAPMPKAMLLGVPITMGLLGAVRWLPIGEQTFSIVGLLVQILGGAAMLYAALRFIKSAHKKALSVWGAITITSLFCIALGTGLAHPDVWRQYEYLIYPLIAVAGFCLAMLSFIIDRFQDTDQNNDLSLRYVEAEFTWFGERLTMAHRWAQYELLSLQSLYQDLWLKVVKQCPGLLCGRKLLTLTDGWGAKITIFALLGLALSWLAG